MAARVHFARIWGWAREQEKSSAAAAGFHQTPLRRRDRVENGVERAEGEEVPGSSQGAAGGRAPRRFEGQVRWGGHEARRCQARAGRGAVRLGAAALRCDGRALRKSGGRERRDHPVGGRRRVCGALPLSVRPLRGGEAAGARQVERTPEEDRGSAERAHGFPGDPLRGGPHRGAGVVRRGVPEACSKRGPPFGVVRQRVHHLRGRDEARLGRSPPNRAGAGRRRHQRPQPPHHGERAGRAARPQRPGVAVGGEPGQQAGAERAAGVSVRARTGG
mmetsp:Transcript_90394/g.180410  ORF Transcript_90394/g.180410 Transcript_90394/m.180410 type:complete len:275 (+) Transcript_90394:156-980(+)